jgi:hypothetical protein
MWDCALTFPERGCSGEQDTTGVEVVAVSAGRAQKFPAMSPWVPRHHDRIARIAFLPGIRELHHD